LPKAEFHLPQIQDYDIFIGCGKTFLNAVLTSPNLTNFAFAGFEKFMELKCTIII